MNLPMQRYIGTKVINASPMTRADYNTFRGWQLPADENGADEGFLVEYTDGGKANTVEYAGYVSWSPKDVFERAYHPLVETAGLTEPNHAMIDLETMGTKPFAPILSIGACALRLDDQQPIIDLFYQPITLESCMELGMRADPGTIRWWMQQEDAARATAFNDNEAVKLPDALDAFTDWINSRPLQVWGNSARFDLGLLEAAYQACNKVVPWLWWAERCYRTVKNLPRAKEVTFEHVGTAHHALDDAVSQALHLRSLNQRLQLQL